MKKLLTMMPALLLAAGSPTWAENAALLLHLQQQISSLAADMQELELSAHNLAKLPPATFDPHAPMPERPEGQSAAVADSGLVFDNEASRLTYLGNVRLNDPHLQLRAAHSLYIALPKAQQEKQPAKQASPTAATATPPQPSAQATAPTPQAPPAPEAQPAQAVVHNAAVDIPNSRVLLQGRKATPSLSLTRGADSALLQCTADGEAAQVFSNAAGDVLLLGSHMVFTWHSNTGETWTLEASAGPVYYEAAQRCLTVLGEARVASPNGSLHCTRQLSITFAPAAQQAGSAQDSPFSAFRAMQFKEVEHVSATGDVVLHAPATDKRPESTLRGDLLENDATTGDCLVTGADCSATHGGYSLAHARKVQLLGNGDALIEAAGDRITGTYERPHPADPASPPLAGTWSTPGPLYYSAADNTLTTPDGLELRDSLTTFRCTGELRARLIASAKPAERRPGMPNLMIANQQGVAHVLAQGDVHLQNQAAGQLAACELMGDSLEAHVPTAQTTLLASAGHRAYVSYGAYALTAQAAADAGASIHLQENGDIQALGAAIHGTLPSDKGAISADCTHELRLQREAGVLTLGGPARIESPDGILTTGSELQAVLAHGSGPSRAPANYPQLNYNYDGLSSAHTSSGGTLRSTQISMQCEGAIHVELQPNASPNADPRQNLRAASAEKHVQLAGRDATGRLLRAVGDTLTYDPATRCFYLRGSRVTLSDANNTHTASGRGACVTIDPRNNVRISGAQQTTTARNIQQQVENNKKK